MTTTLLPPGYFAVPDPDDRATITFWSVDDRGVVRDFPAGARWRPLPPSGLDRGGKDEWYATEYRAWRQAVAVAIATDPAAARAAFCRRYPYPDEVAPVPKPPRVRARAALPQPDPYAAQRRQVDDTAALVAHALQCRGATVDGLSAALALPRATAWRRAQRGRELARAAGADSRALVDRALVEKFAVTVAQRSGGRLDEEGLRLVRSVSVALLGEEWPPAPVGDERPAGRP